MTDIFAICGNKRSGKSRVAETMEANGYERVSFATPLKRILAETFNRDTSCFYDPLRKDWRISWDAYGDDVAFCLFNDTLIQTGLTTWAIDQLWNEPSVQNNRIQGMTCTAGEFKETLKNYVYCWEEEDATARQIMQEFGTDILRNFNEDIHVEWFEKEIEGKTKYVCDDARFPNELQFLARKGAETVWLHRPSLGIPTDMHASETSIGQSDCDLCVLSAEGELLDRSVSYRLQKGEWAREVVM